MIHEDSAASSPGQLAGDSRMYLLTTDAQTHGPFLGSTSLDFRVLKATFLSERYARADAAGEEYCWIDEGDFPKWLVECGHLQALDVSRIDASIDQSGDNAYVPSSWPLCPACGMARCDERGGEIRHLLNRQQWYRQCPKCEHRFDQHERPYRAGPMLDDTGWNIAGSCGPYALSQVAGIPFHEALAACQQAGWTTRHGMSAGQLGQAAQLVGGSLRAIDLSMTPRTSATLTLQRFMSYSYGPGPRAFILEVPGHFLPVVGDVNLDRAGTGPRAQVQRIFEYLAEEKAHA